MRGWGVTLFAACITGMHMRAVRSLHNRDDYIKQNNLKFMDNEKTPEHFGLVFQTGVWFPRGQWKCPYGQMLALSTSPLKHAISRDKCLDFDWESMGSDVSIDTHCGAYTKCSGNSRGSTCTTYQRCEQDLNNKDGYCMELSQPKYYCGTGACCRNKEYDVGIAGCDCQSNHPVFAKDSEWPRRLTFGDQTTECINDQRTSQSIFKCVPSLKFLLCTCVDGPNDGYYIDENSIQTPYPQCFAGTMLQGESKTFGGNCIPCSEGKFKSEQDTFYDHPECQDCERGKFSDKLGASHCSWCPVGQYQPDMGKSSCANCQPCDEEQKHETTRCNAGEGDTRTTQDCVCAIGYERVGSVCDPVRKNWYKDKIGDRNAERCPITADGTQMVTLNVGSTSIHNCTCPENMYYDDKNDQCIQCEWYRPWRKLEWPDDASKCKACESWQYWSDVSGECLEIERMRIVQKPGESFDIEGVDKWRRQNARHMKNVESLSTTQYLLINEDDSSLNNTVKECSLHCGHFAKREGCGNEAMPKWISFKVGDTTFQRIVRSLPITTGEDLDFWSNQIQSPRIMREGRCTRCVNCASGEYQSGCTETNTCSPCAPVACQSSEYKSHPIKATFLGGTWTGACDQKPNVADVPYTCTPCRHWENEGGRYMLMLGCGSETTYTRWHPDNVNDNELASLTCTYGDTSHSECKLPNQDNFASTSDMVPFTHKIPYCKPGWYVDVSDELCPLSQDDGGSAWSAACCKICGSENEGQEIRAHDYKTCTGRSTEDTERYTDRCENNYHRTWNGNAEECALCTSCES